MASANAPSVPGCTGSHTSARAVSASAMGRMSMTRRPASCAFRRAAIPLFATPEFSGFAPQFTSSFVLSNWAGAHDAAPMVTFLLA